MVTVGEDVNGAWYALVHFRHGDSVRKQFRESRQDALDAVKVDLIDLREDLGRLTF